MSPIYSTEGNFLGTDDQGLQGKAIVMNKDNFTQGMSHEDALLNSLGAKGLNSHEAQTKLLDHYNGLKDRPDYDGYLTFGEVTKWSNQGNGEPLFVNATKINLSAISVPELKQDKDGYINFFPNSAPNTGLVYGTIKLNLLNENTGAVRLGAKMDFLTFTILKILYLRQSMIIYPLAHQQTLIYIAHLVIQKFGQRQKLKS